MNIPILNILQRVSGPIRQYIEKQALIRQLESLSEHELQDAGVVRGSIPVVVEGLYGNKGAQVDIREHDESAVSPKLQIVRRECAHC